ncbi:MAG: beta-N-acetylglucosaminidase domain-containing protein [Muribaculaceae bacterium]|nr:beta-N-acetylglucosaminidase domain-containing protein [Muribaculaceae bacterium]
MKFRFTLAALLLPALAGAISPEPQKMHTTDGSAFCARKAVYKLTGADEADPDAVNALHANLKTDGTPTVEIIIGERGDDAVKNVAEKIPEVAEGYYLNIVSPNRVIIAGADEAGTFYGVQTFLQLAAGDSHCVAALEIIDSPAMPKRGVIEGFYGNPWSHNDRLSQFDFYGRNKMNYYIYGPKDDPYHHSRWYEPYPANKAREMKELVSAAHKNKVKFVWAMHPSNSIETPEDRAKALDKFSRMYDLGVRDFAIFFDDISAKSVDSQIDYLNFLDREFVKKHSDVGNLIVCPTMYNKAWSGGDYLQKMGTGLNPDIEIMWTGNSVCDMINTEDCQWFTDQTTRLPFIWLNYPVNDYGQHNLLMGPVTGNDREIAPMVAAFCSNPMQYAEASKVALYQLADFAWNPEAYDADRSWLNATAALEPGNIDAFRTFCLNNVDVAPSVHGLRFYGETPDFAELMAANPEITPAAVIQFLPWFEARRDAANELLVAADAGDPLLSEVREWIVALQVQALQGIELARMAEALLAENPNGFINSYKEFAALTDEAENIVSRGFDGSIQSVRVQTGTLHVKPWIKTASRQLADIFKASGAQYPADLFPQQTLENGTYYIKHNGRWLGNPDAGAKGGAPVFQDAIDDINPNRQEWHIRLDPVTERYSIVNSKDERYLNEVFKFGVNPYNRDWNTYIIRKQDGKFSIQNAGNGGQKFWGVDGNQISGAQNSENHFIFEIIPVTD